MSEADRKTPGGYLITDASRADAVNSAGLSKLLAEIGNAIPDLAGELCVFHATVVEEGGEVVDRLGDLASFLVQQCQVVVRGCALGIHEERLQERFASLPHTAGGPLGERQVDDGLDVRRIKPQCRPKLGSRLVIPALPQPEDAQIVVRFRVSRIDHERSLKLLLRLVSQLPFAVQQAEVVASIGVELVAPEQDLIVQERTLEITSR